MKNREARVKTVLPVHVDGHKAGTTTDVSAKGVFFETDEAMENGTPIRFSISLDSGGEKFLLQCEGEIVRIEERGEKTGVAARIVASKLVKQET